MVDAIIYRKFSYNGELTLMERDVLPNGQLGEAVELEIDQNHPLANLTFAHVLLMAKLGDETYELLERFVVKDSVENEPAIIDHLVQESIESVVSALIKSYLDDPSKVLTQL